MVEWMWNLLNIIHKKIDEEYIADEQAIWLFYIRTRCVPCASYIFVTKVARIQ